MSAASGMTRRTLVLSLGSAVAGAYIPVSAAAQGAPAAVRFRTIAIDTSRLAALGDPQMADMVQNLLAPELRKTFDDLMGPDDRNAPSLVARIHSISLSDDVGGRAYGGRGGTTNVDYLEGAGVVTLRGHVVSETPVLSALDAGYSGPWYLPGIDERRVASITQHFAYWLRREMGV